MRQGGLSGDGAALRRYYDRLSRSGRKLFGLLGGGDGAEHLTVHRMLIDPDAPAAPPGPLALERFLERAIDWPDAGDAFEGLDIGCGLGGVSLRLAAARGGSWLGLTISPVQAATANKAARKRGLGARARYLERSYDAPFSPEERFDVAFAIESLAHSSDKAASLCNLAGALRSGAQLVIVEDVPDLELIGASEALRCALAQFEAGWMAPQPPDEGGWRAAFSAAQLDVTAVEDLTPYYRPRAEEELAQLMVTAEARRAREGAEERRALIDGEIGGLALERLYNAGAMRYLLITARRK